MRNIMEKLMGIKKDGGQEVLITLGLVAVGIVLLLAFSKGADGIISTMIGDATTNMAKLFNKAP